MAIIVDSYSEANQNQDYARYFDSGTFGGQSFEGDGRTLNSVQLYLKKSGTVNGTLRILIYAHDGTYGSTGVPTGAVLATSASINAVDLGTAYGLEEFTFSGGDKITLTNGTHYFVVLDYVDFTESGWVGWGYDDSSPSHGGNYAAYYSASWHAIDTRDFCFYVYGDEIASESPSLSPSASLSPSLSSSPSGSASPSASESASESASLSPSPSQSPSASQSPSGSESPSPPPSIKLVRIAKPGKDAINPDDASDLIFSSEYGTLKYFSKQTKDITIDASTGDIAATGIYTHGLNYYPFVEVFVDVYIGAKTNNYEYCPFAGAGAAVFYGAKYKITKTTVQVYGEINGVSVELWHFDFLIFVFKNDLKLS